MMNANFLDKPVTPCDTERVRLTRDDNSSVMGSPIAGGDASASHPTFARSVGDPNALHSPTRDCGSTSVNNCSPGERNVRYVAFQGTAGSGSGDSLYSTNLNSDQSKLNHTPSISRPSESNPREGALSDPTAGRGPEALSPVPGFLWSSCMECKRVYDLKITTPEQDGELSHGYCPGCGPSVLARFLAPMAWVTLFIPWSLLAMAGGVPW